MKTFLSRVSLPGPWAARQGFSNPYRLHQWIWDALPADPEARRDFLFRADSANGVVRVLLLSERPPAPSADFAWETTKLSPTFLFHPAYRFRLRANPTYRRASDRRRLGYFHEPDIRAWFERKFAAAGCDLRSLETTAPRRIRFSKRPGAPQSVISSVDASGILSVRDESAFRAAFDSGFGHAKGFGFGLLMLQPVQP